MENFKGSSINLVLARLLHPCILIFCSHVMPQLELVEQPEYNNPYLDSTTRIMYRMMKKNDCLPYWYTTNFS